MDYETFALDADDVPANPLFAAFIASLALVSLGLATLIVGAVLDATADTSAVVSSESMASNLNELSSGLQFGSATAVVAFGCVALALFGVLILRGLNSRD
ncbi:MAG: hypothetical protein ACH36H_01325 [Candidatus Nanopelagicales bacterium]